MDPYYRRLQKNQASYQDILSFQGQPNASLRWKSVFISFTHFRVNEDHPENKQSVNRDDKGFFRFSDCEGQ